MIRGAAAAGGLALVAALTGCNGSGSDDSGGSGGTSTADFCASFNGLYDSVLAADPSDSGAMVRAFQDWAADMEGVDPPPAMPEDARHGLELFVDQAQGIDEDVTLEQLERLGEGLSDADQAAGQAFNDWTQAHCPLDDPSSSP